MTINHHSTEPHLTNLHCLHLFAAELSCGIDWHSPYSCPYWSYTTLLVLAPVLLSLAAKTVAMAYKWATEGSRSGSETVQNNKRAGRRLVAEKLRRWLGRLDRAAGGASRHQVDSAIELSPLSPRVSSSATAAQSPGTLSPEHAPFSSPRLSVGSTASALCLLRARSSVLRESGEVPTCLLVSLLALLAVCPRLLFTFKEACLQDHKHFLTGNTLNQTCSQTLSPSPSGPTANQQYTFYPTFIEEFTHTVLIPFTFLLFHPRMRFAGTE